MKILLASNDEQYRASIESFLLSQGHETVLVPDNEQALRALKNETAELVLWDVSEPGKPFRDFLLTVKKEHRVPVITMLPSRDKDDILQGIRSEADELLFKPFLKEELLLKIRNIARFKEYRTSLDTIAFQRADYLHKILKESGELNREMIYRLLAAAEYKDDETGKHIIRVAQYSRVIAENLGFKGEFLDLIEGSAPMHDLGKIGIPDRMLFKSGKLTDKELEIMKSHTVIGASILEGSQFPLINMAHDIALNHHEKWDGSGYPDGKKGINIPLTARIVALADAFDALTSPRPYKPPFSFDKSLIILREGKGTHFDPATVNAFTNVLVDIRTIYKEYMDTAVLSASDEIDSIERIR
jgi:putative two-component system response regulator